MSALLEEPKLTYSQKFSRLGKRLRDPEWQRFGRNLLIGKFLGLAVLPVVLLVIQGVLNWFTIHSAYADTGAHPRSGAVQRHAAPTAGGGSVQYFRISPVRRASRPQRRHRLGLGSYGSRSDDRGHRHGRRRQQPGSRRS